MSYLLKLVFIFSLISCGSKTTRKFKKSAIPEAYYYSFSEDDCETGEQSFYSLQEACEALLDDELNDYCALEEREKLYDSSCNIDWEAMERK